MGWDSSEGCGHPLGGAGRMRGAGTPGVGFRGANRRTEGFDTSATWKETNDCFRPKDRIKIRIKIHSALKKCFQMLWDKRDGVSPVDARPWTTLPCQQWCRIGTCQSLSTHVRMAATNLTCWIGHPNESTWS